MIEELILKIRDKKLTVEEADDELTIYFQTQSISKYLGSTPTGKPINSIYGRICQMSSYDQFIAYSFHDENILKFNQDIIDDEKMIIPIREHAKYWWKFWTEEKIGNDILFCNVSKKINVQNYS